ncbi:3-hydroxyacyl-CoA dehydrogenase [Streptomyces sp. NPDC047009]|uniref:3-hydroxyacyl-CoA dehydrogenase n=1 Tax=Streptomyces sp. NPDC047009 TaxID=3154496 RepID=UPI0033FC9128
MQDELTVAVVGAGAMGRGIAQLFAVGGHRVLLTDVRRQAADDALTHVHAMIDRLAAKGRLDDPAAVKERLRAVDEAPSADLVIEAVVEDLDVKRRLFAELESRMDAKTVFATNTSSLSVTAIAAGLDHPERLCGLHFFNPVPLMRLVEVVPGERTNAELPGRLAHLVRRLGHEPLVVADAPGFLVNHAGRPYTSEALRLLDEGVAAPADIDRICREAAGFRMGPFELIDLIGLDVNVPVSESVYRGFYDDPRLRPSPTGLRRLTAGRLGRKTGEGFYRYDGSGRPEPVPEPQAPVYGGTPVWSEDAQLASMLRAAGVTVVPEPVPGTVAILAPWAKDVTTAALDAGLPPEHTVGVDPCGGFTGRFTLAASPATAPAAVEAAHSALAATGHAVSVTSDSTGFVAQRLLAVIVNTACEMAQFGLASPADIDTAVTLGLGYPHGPLTWGDRIGPERVLGALEGLHSAYRDPRYRPSVWLSRRARLGMPLRDSPRCPSAAADSAP